MILSRLFYSFRKTEFNDHYAKKARNIERPNEN